MSPPFFHPFFQATNRSHWLLWISMPHWRLPGAIEMDELVVWDGGLGFLVGNGWVNCFTKTHFCRALDGRDYVIYVFFMDLTSMTCQSLMQVIYMNDSEDEELEASLVLQTNSWTRTLEKPRHPLPTRGFSCSQFVPLDFLFDFGASQTSPWNDKLLDVVGGGTMFEASSQQHGHLNGWTN